MTYQEFETWLNEHITTLSKDEIYWQIKEDTIASIQKYVVFGVPPGGFVEAVLANDLMEAIARADQENGRTLKAIATYVYMEIPDPSHGSYEKVGKWMEVKQAEFKGIL